MHKAFGMVPGQGTIAVASIGQIKALKGPRVKKKIFHFCFNTFPQLRVLNSFPFLVRESTGGTLNVIKH